MSKYLYIRIFDDTNTDDYGVGVWFSGCTHHCKNCQNPMSWNENNGEEFSQKTIYDIINHFKENEKFYGNLFLTGGDPLCEYNIDCCTKFVKQFKETFSDKFPIWIWTGYNFEEVKDFEILKYIDVLIDGRFIDELKDYNLEYRGSSNQRVIDVKETLKHGEIIYYKNIK